MWLINNRNLFCSALEAGKFKAPADSMSSEDLLIHIQPSFTLTSHGVKDRGFS